MRIFFRYSHPYLPCSFRFFLTIVSIIVWLVFPSSKRVSSHPSHGLEQLYKHPSFDYTWSYKKKKKLKLGRQTLSNPAHGRQLSRSEHPPHTRFPPPFYKMCSGQSSGSGDSGVGGLVGCCVVLDQDESSVRFVVSPALRTGCGNGEGEELNIFGRRGCGAERSDS